MGFISPPSLPSPGGRDYFSFSAFSLSTTTKVQRDLLHQTLNFILSSLFLDLNRSGILSPGWEQTVLDFLHFVRHGYEGWRAHSQPLKWPPTPHRLTSRVLSPGRMAQLIVPINQCHRLDAQSRHIPKLRVWSPGWDEYRSNWSMFLSFSLPSSLSKINKRILGWWFF